MRPQVLADGQSGGVDMGGELAAHVAVVPGLVVVASDRGLALRVAQDPAVLPAMLGEPATRWRGFGDEGRRPCGGEVDREAELVLGVARARRELDRRGVAIALGVRV